MKVKELSRNDVSIWISFNRKCLKGP
jgi:hypothetical protein